MGNENWGSAAAQGDVSSVGAAGGFEELSPQEFNRRKDLVVVLLKVDHASHRFEGFRGLIAAERSQDVPGMLGGLAPGQAIGLVCPDGDCSGRLAIRLSNLGFQVYHLAGGLLEWYHSFRGGKLSHA